MSASDAWGQDMMGSGGYKEGYGAYGTMGQNPDEILAYGRAMMRYGFRETGMSGGSSKYPGYEEQKKSKQTLREKRRKKNGKTTPLGLNEK